MAEHVKAMLDFQRMQNEALELPGAEHSLEQLCAFVNNNERCFDRSNEVLEALREQLGDSPAAARLDVLEVTDQGFMDTARSAMRKAVDVVFADPGLLGVFSALFAQPEWWSGQTVATLCATLADYCADLREWLSEPFFRRTAEAAMERTVALYCAALLTQCRAVKTDAMARMAEDEAQLRDVFSTLVKPQALATAFQTLSDLRELASASSEREIAAAFGTMLAHAPGTGVEVVAKVMVRRGGLVCGSALTPAGRACGRTSRGR
jgi:exocyst complex component 3